jgi:APA family basic amino acid/polyamine antiporter
VPILGILSALYLIWTLPALTKIVVVGWLLFGLIVYFTYSVRHSKVQQALREEAVDVPPPAALR